MRPLLRLCIWSTDSVELYRVSTPSGIMTISEVPTKTPMPKVEIRRNCDCDRVRDRGNRPARKDLGVVHVRMVYICIVSCETYAIAITALKESRVTKPSSILKSVLALVYCGRFSLRLRIDGDTSSSLRVL